MIALRIACVSVTLIGFVATVNWMTNRRAPGPVAQPAKKSRIPKVDADRGVETNGRPAVAPRNPAPSTDPVAKDPAWDRATLLEKLRRGTPEERQTALRLLSATSETGLVREAVAVLFDTYDPTLQLKAVELIRLHEIAEEAPRLAGIVGSTSAGPNLREQAAEALGEVGDASIAGNLRNLYAQGDASGRRLAAQLLENLGDQGYVADFVRLAAESLQDRRPEGFGKRLVMVAEAGRVQNAGVRDVMAVALADPEAAVRYQAIYWLGEHGEVTDLQDLELMKNEKDPYMRSAVEEASGKIRHRRNG